MQFFGRGRINGHFDRVLTARECARGQDTSTLMTLLVHRVDAFAKSATRRLVPHPKVFFFDVGVLNGLLGNFVASPDRIGRLFAHLVYTQLVHSAAAFDDDARVSTFRTEHGAEVDFIVERGAELFAIECKAPRTVAAADLRGLERFSDYYGKPHRRMVWYLGKKPKRLGGVDVLPWQQGLKAIRMVRTS